MHRILTTGASALVLSTVVLAGCGPSDSLQPAANEATFPVYSGEVLPDIAFEDLGFDTVDENGAYAEYSGDVLVTVTSDESELTSEMTAVDATDGSTLWQLGSRDHDDLMDEADSSRGSFAFDSMVIGHDGSILVAHETINCAVRTACTSAERAQARLHGPQWAVVALDPADGSMQWTEPLPTYDDDLHHTDVRPVGSTSDLVIVNATQRTPLDGEDVSVAVAFDPRDGEVAWTAEGYEAAFVDGDVVAAGSASTSDEDPRRVALDASTGEQAWELETGEREGWESDYLPRADGAAVTMVDGTYGIVDLETGAVLERLGDDDPLGIGTGAMLGGRLGAPYPIGLGGNEDGWLAAWVEADDDGGVLHTLGSGESVKSRSEHQVEGLGDGAMVAGVSTDGYIWIVDPDKEIAYAVDRTGAKRSEEIEGFPALLGDGSLLIADDQSNSYTRNLYLRSYEAA